MDTRRASHYPCTHMNCSKHFHPIISNAQIQIFLFNFFLSSLSSIMFVYVYVGWKTLESERIFIKSRRIWNDRREFCDMKKQLFLHSFCSVLLLQMLLVVFHFMSNLDGFSFKASFICMFRFFFDDTPFLFASNNNNNTKSNNSKFVYLSCSHAHISQRSVYASTETDCSAPMRTITYELFRIYICSVSFALALFVYVSVRFALCASLCVIPFL